MTFAQDTDVTSYVHRALFCSDLSDHNTHFHCVMFSSQGWHKVSFLRSNILNDVWECSKRFSWLSLAYVYINYWWMTVLDPSIHPSIHLVLSGVMGVCWSLSQLSSGERQGYTLDRSPVHRRTLIHANPFQIFFSLLNISNFFLAHLLTNWRSFAP